MFNLYPRKGTIALGSDADLTIIDPNLEQVVTPELCRSAQDHTPFEGVSVKGWPTTTILRGSAMLRDGEIAKEWPGTYLNRTGSESTGG